MVIIGIDLGVTGAIAAVDSRGSATVSDLPIIKDANGKRLDAAVAIHTMRSLLPAAEAGLVVMENVHVQQVKGRRMSHSTETTLVGLRFAVQALCDIARFRFELVSPQVWKAHFGIKADKTGSVARERAAAMYPLQAHMLKRVADHNRAEALLIARYGLDKLA